MRRPAPWLFALILLVYAGVSVWPAWNKVSDAKHGRDFATYHYAAAEALDGGDPYATRALSKRARKDRTRKSVHPYFYPPPFLAAVLWSPAFELLTAYHVWFWFNQLLVLAAAALFRLWFRVPWAVLAVLLLSFTPITDNAKMGQANLLVLVAAVAWAVRRAYRPIAAAVAMAIGSSVVALLWVDMDAQVRFYTEVLPGFSTGNYHGLTVRIGLPANHSIPDLFNQLWPGPDRHTLSDSAAMAGKACSLSLLAGLAWLARHRRDSLGNAALFGAVTVLMLITPVYTYEHHLVMAMFPAAVVGAALMDGRLGRWGWAVGLPAYFFTAWPLYWLRPAQKAIPSLHWWLQESKFIGLFALGMLCVAAVLNSPRKD